MSSPYFRLGRVGDPACPHPRSGCCFRAAATYHFEGFRVDVTTSREGAREILAGSLADRDATTVRTDRMEVRPGERVLVQFALVRAARDTLATWEHGYTSTANVWVELGFFVQSVDPCPTFFCRSSETIELSGDVPLPAGDQLWVRLRSSCIDCGGAITKRSSGPTADNRTGGGSHVAARRAREHPPSRCSGRVSPPAGTLGAMPARWR